MRKLAYGFIALLLIMTVSVFVYMLYRQVTDPPEKVDSQESVTIEDDIIPKENVPAPTVPPATITTTPNTIVTDIPVPLAKPLSAFRVTKETHAATDDIDSIVLQEFGNDYRVADWQDVNASVGSDISSAKAWADGLGIVDGGQVLVTYNGVKTFGQASCGTRYYFIQRDDAPGTPGYFLVHDEIGDGLLMLGSWCGLNMRILAINKSGSDLTAVGTSQPAQMTSTRIEQIAQDRLKAKKASVKSTMASIVPAAVICRNLNKAVISGKGGTQVCAGENYTWPAITDCGPNSTYTNWVVKNGTTDGWDFVLDCKQFIDCNGPQNAICSRGGCRFNGNCQ